MSSAPAAAAAADAAAPEDAPKAAGSKKKKILFLVAGLVAVLVVAAAAAVVMHMMKKRAEAAMEAAAGGAAETATDTKEKPEHTDEKKSPPTFVPLDQFTVNLADRDQDRFAQVGLVLEIDDAKVAEDIKTYMPSIRNAILLLLSHKTSVELIEPEGKEQLAEDVRVAAAQAMGLNVAPAEDLSASAPRGKAKHKKGQDDNPIVHVNYSSFIIQ